MFVKVTISYTEGEQRNAKIIATFVKELLDGKLRRSEKHKPFLHIYISSKDKKPTPWQLPGIVI